MLLGVGTFVACIALFVALDVNLLFMNGPAAGIAYALVHRLQVRPRRRVLIRFADAHLGRR